MSLINEVLNQLEQRGVQQMSGHKEVRAVAVSPDHNWLRWSLVALLIVSAVILSIYFWPKQQQPTVALTSAQSEVVSATTLTTDLKVSEPAAPDVLLAMSESPASKLSYELSATPLPDSLREPKVTKLEESAKISLPISGIAKLTTKPILTDSSAVAPSLLETLPVKQVSKVQQADAEFIMAKTLHGKGHVTEALAKYEAALKLDPKLGSARLALTALLMESSRSGEAERVMQDGLKVDSANMGFSILLARIQVERNKLDQALETMQHNLPNAETRADYQAFYAALLQRQGRHKEAVNHFQIALQLQPSNGIWLMGYGISLQEVQRIEDAKEAYRKALATHSLNPQLTAFVEQKLKAL